MSKVFAYDIDGTFLNDKHEVQDSHIYALTKAKENGHINVLCSGRPYADMIQVLNAVPLGLFQYLICNNGAYLVDLENDEKIMEKEVPFELVDEVKKIASISKFGFAIHTIDGVYRGKLWTGENPKWFYELNERMEEKEKSFYEWEVAREISKNERISQVSLIGEEKDIQAALKLMKSSEHDVDIHIAGKVYLDVNPQGVSKLTGIETLANRIGVSTQDFVAFGDSGNDLQMLRGVGLGIAMGNGTIEAQDAADIVIGDNNSAALGEKVLELI